jgi:hypothetical protein
MAKLFKNPWVPWTTLCILIVVSIIKRQFDDRQKVRLFEGETKIIEVVLVKTHRVYNTGYTLWFSYKVNDEVINNKWSGGGYTFLEQGDTILIKYSVEDPTVIEVVDPCYMQKHKGKSYCK